MGKRAGESVAVEKGSREGRIVVDIRHVDECGEEGGADDRLVVRVEDDAGEAGGFHGGENQVGGHGREIRGIGANEGGRRRDGIDEVTLQGLQGRLIVEIEGAIRTSGDGSENGFNVERAALDEVDWDAGGRAAGGELHVAGDVERGGGGVGAGGRRRCGNEQEGEEEERFVRHREAPYVRIVARPGRRCKEKTWGRGHVRRRRRWVCGNGSVGGTCGRAVRRRHGEGPRVMLA